MPRPVNLGAVHDEFTARVDELLDWEAVVDAMAEKTPRKVWTRRRPCESILVLAFSQWERYVESVFRACLARDASRLGQEWGLPIGGRIPLPLAEALIAGAGYFGFKSYGDLLGRAKKLLVRHPFGQVSAKNRLMLDDLQAMRNHVLHQSRKSWLQLRKRLPRRRDVGVHLDALEGGRRRLRVYLERMKAASQELR